MKILLLGSSLGIGGAEQALVNVANELDKYHDITITVVRAGSFRYKLNKGIQVNVLGNKSYIPFFKNVRKLSSKNFDLAINFHDWNYVSQRILNNVKAKRKLLWVHNNRTEELAPVHLFTYKHFGKRWKYKAIAVSEVAAMSHKSIFSRHQPQIRVIENLVNSDWKNVTSNKKIIVNIARDAKVKNHDLMIDILNNWDGEEIIFKQYGVPIDSKTSIKYKSVINKNVSIKMMGKVRDVWNDFEAKTLVLPSTVEGQPMVIMESMSRGMNVVATPFNTMKDKEVESLIYRSKTFESNELKSLIEKSLQSNLKTDLIKKHQDNIFHQMRNAVEKW